METYLKKIKNKQIDSIQLFFLFFLVPLLLISLLRVFETGWQWIYFLQILLCLSTIIFYILRSRFSVSVKTHFCCILLLLACFSGAIRFSISGGFYLCLLASVISVLVFGKRIGFIYLFISIIGLGIIGALHILKIIHADLDFNSYNNNVFSWVMLIATMIYLQTSIILSIGMVHKYFEDNIDSLTKKTEDNDRLQIELKVSEAQYRSLITTAVIPIIISNTKGDLLFVNESAEKLFDVKISDLEEKNILHFLRNINRRNELVHELEMHGDFQNKEVELYDKNQKKISVLLSSNIITYDGQPAILKFLNDVTAEKNAYILEKKNQQLLFEKEKVEISEQMTRSFVEELTNAKELLSQSERKYRLIAENTSDGIIAYDSDRKINYVSSSYLKQLGYGIDEEIGNDLNVISTRIHPDDLKDILSIINRTFELKQKEFYLTYRAKTKTGDYIWREDHVNQHFDEQGRFEGSYVICRDITERKKNEEEMSRLNAELRQLATHLQTLREEERTALAKEIHDELSQNIVALSMNAAYIKDSLEDKNLKVKDLIDEQIDIASNVIKRSRGIFNSLRPTMLDELGLEFAIRWYAKEQLKSLKIKIAVNSNIENEKFSKGINISLFRIFQDVISNVKYHSKASEVFIDLLVNGNNLTMSIQDNGVGFETKSIDIIYSHGILGIRERVYALNGKLKIDSVIGKGTTVTIIAPLIE